MRRWRPGRGVDRVPWLLMKNTLGSIPKNFFCKKSHTNKIRRGWYWNQKKGEGGWSDGFVEKGGEKKNILVGVTSLK